MFIVYLLSRIPAVLKTGFAEIISLCLLTMVGILDSEGFYITTSMALLILAFLGGILTIVSPRILHSLSPLADTVGNSRSRLS
jgi:hypothetical protein